MTKKKETPKQRAARLNELETRTRVLFDLWHEVSAEMKLLRSRMWEAGEMENDNA